MKKVLLTATVQSHICQFHKPLVKMLHDSGYEVFVAARDNLAEKNGLTLDFADKVYDIPFERSPLNPNNFKAYKMLKKIIDENDFQFVHTNTPAGGVYTRLACAKARKKGTKVIYTAHGFHFYDGAPKKNWIIYYPIEKLMAKYFTDTLITINSADYNLAKEKFDCDIRYIHGVGANSEKYFVMSEKEKSDIRNKFGINSTDKIIVNIGELLPNKNQKTAILAMKDVVKKYPSSKLFIAGNGPELDNLRTLTKECSLEENVKFLGYTLELNKYLNIADCVVACSFREGLPLNVMETMLCGKTIVASSNRGHLELVKDGITGYIVEPTDTKAFADKICQVLENPNAFSSDCIERAKPFTDKSVYTELEKIYFS